MTEGKGLAMTEGKGLATTEGERYGMTGWEATLKGRTFSLKAYQNELNTERGFHRA